MVDQDFLFDVLFQHSIGKDRSTGERDVEQRYVETVVKTLGRVVVDESK